MIAKNSAGVIAALAVIFLAQDLQLFSPLTRPLFPDFRGQGPFSLFWSPALMDVLLCNRVVR
jgi:hypothetical protein